MTEHYGHHNHYNKLHIPDHWEHYWSKYPNGYTLLEALISWTSQVNDMIVSYNHMSDDMVALDRNFRALDKELRASWQGYKDHTEKTYADFREELFTILNNWIATIEPTIQDTVVSSLSGWLDDGTLADIINTDVFNMKANSSDLEKTNNVIDTYISPANFDNLDEAIAYCFEHQKTLKADEIILTKDTNFRGISLEINTLNKGDFVAELGGYNGVALPKRQVIQKIGTVTSVADYEMEKLIVRGIAYSELSIGYYRGTLCFRLNDAENTVFGGTLSKHSRYIAYNKFHFIFVLAIDIDNDDFVSDNPEDILWANENNFTILNFRNLKMSGTYSHNLNRFYGGTAEAVSESIAVEIENGNSNSFYDIRSESPKNGRMITYKFGRGTRNNKVYLNHDTYSPQVIDEGTFNGVVKQITKDARLVRQVSAEVKNYDNTKNVIDGLQANSALTNLVPKGGYAEPNIIYETPFLEDPKSLLFHTAVTLNAGLGVGVEYKVYDKGFNDISSTIKADGFLLYRLSTLHTSVFDGNYSGFTAPNTLTGNWRNVDNKPPLYNDKVVLEPTTQWGAYYDKKDSIYQYPDIKYVKFFVHYDPIYSNLVTGSLSMKDLTVSVYDVTANYHTNYYNN